jgi:hypothetical protein
LGSYDRITQGLLHYFILRYLCTLNRWFHIVNLCMQLLQLLPDLDNLIPLHGHFRKGWLSTESIVEAAIIGLNFLAKVWPWKNLWLLDVAFLVKALACGLPEWNQPIEWIAVASFVRFATTNAAQFCLEVEHVSYIFLICCQHPAWFLRLLPLLYNLLSNFY